VIDRSCFGVVAAGCTALIGASCARSNVANPPAAPTIATALDRVVRDVCDKRIVLLGEDANHGGGATLVAKTVLVTRLIDECHFSVVVFESSMPEFVDVNRAFAAGQGSPARVADAVGGTWSVAGESDGLIAALFERASREQIALAGIDGQLGSTDSYMQTRLPDELAGYLAEPRRSACDTELERYVRWDYDDATPFDDGARTRLRGCLTETETAASGRDGSPPAEEAAEMAIALRGAIEASDPALSADAGASARDKAMYQALQWHIARLQPNRKIIVWCATVHAAKSLRDVPDLAGFVPLGSYVHRDFGDAAASIGVSALAGSFGRRNRPSTELVPAPPDSFEARAFAGGAPGDLGYLGRADLVRYGRGTARALDYGKLTEAPWSEIIDGLLVLREERVPTFIHAATPRS
jgi:erythromycin esterase-like protein